MKEPIQMLVEGLQLGHHRPDDASQALVIHVESLCVGQHLVLVASVGGSPEPLIGFKQSTHTVFPALLLVLEDPREAHFPKGSQALLEQGYGLTNGVEVLRREGIVPKGRHEVVDGIQLRYVGRQLGGRDFRDGSGALSAGKNGR
jgi:hypothetical protein